MEISKIKKLTPYQDVNDIMVFFLKRLEKILGDNFLGLPALKLLSNTLGV